jgi:hypothetical protein
MSSLAGAEGAAAARPAAVIGRVAVFAAIGWHPILLRQRQERRGKLDAFTIRVATFPNARLSRHSLVA